MRANQQRSVLKKPALCSAGRVIFCRVICLPSCCWAPWPLLLHFQGVPAGAGITRLPGAAVHYSHPEDTALITCTGDINWGRLVLFWFWILFWQQGRYEDKHVKAACLDASPWNPLVIPLLFTMGEIHCKQRAAWSLCVIELPTFIPWALPVHRINVIIRQQRKSVI